MVQMSPIPPQGPAVAGATTEGALRAPLMVDLNSLLILANAVIATLIVQGWANAGNNQYVDGLTPVLGVLLCAETVLALLLERRSRDPFVTLLAFITTFYFSLRIYTLTLFPFSGVFDRFAYAASDTDYALIFIIIANVFMYAGLRAVPFKGHLAVQVGRWRAASPFRACLLLLAAIGFGFFKGNYWTPENIPRVLNFLVLFIEEYIIVLMALSYFILFRRSFSGLAAVVLALLVIGEIVLSVLFGSRSAIVTTIQTCMLVVLAIAGCIRVPARWLTLGVLSLPALVLLMGASFVIATHNRENKDTGAKGKFDVTSAIEFSRQGAETLSDDRDLAVILPPIFARGGFFDFAAELIAHREQYASVFTLSTYYKSIVDNLLTPGFDVYDQPKIGNALEFVYEGLGDPSKIVAEEFYQSDQLEIYGEFYAMYGYLSLPLFFIVAWLLKRVYVRLKAGDPYALTMKRVVVLFIWVEVINSFGLDWLAAEVFPLVFAIFMWRFFFASKLAPQGARSRPNGARGAPPAECGVSVA